MDKVKVYAVCASKWNSFWLSVGGGRWCDPVTQNYLVTFLRLFVLKIVNVTASNQDLPMWFFFS